MGFEVALFALAAVLDTFAPNGTQTILFTNLVSGLMATFAVLMAGIVAVGLVGAGGWVALARA
ncbi:hypothetical protein [Halarchaeum sp. P4]|uniref:hypothetical protein n=1 Tax=Halarchaeum sp. P4 TaxID=3421639 RepID=UPI003EB828DF